MKNKRFLVLCLALLMVAANIFNPVQMQVFAQDNDESAVTDMVELVPADKITAETPAEDVDQAADAAAPEEVAVPEKPAVPEGEQTDRKSVV